MHMTRLFCLKPTCLRYNINNDHNADRPVTDGMKDAKPFVSPVWSVCVAFPTSVQLRQRRLASCSVESCERQ